MKRLFVDANVFLRFFTTDDAGHHTRAAALFKSAAAGEITLVTGPPVLFEIAWTLKAAYGQPHERILDVLSAILALPGLGLTDASLAGRVVSLSRSSGQEFADAYIAASAEEAGADAVATFNRKHFEKLGAALHGF